MEHTRTLYRRDDLTALSPLGTAESLALPGQSYTLAFTAELLAVALVRRRGGLPDEPLLPAPAASLTGRGADQGGYVLLDGGYWIPTSRSYLDPAVDVADPESTAALERASARQHFYLPRKLADAFDHSTLIEYDARDLLVVRTTDALGNEVAALNDYRVLQPRLVTDPNGNQRAVAFDALGHVVATAVMGKEGEALGDRLQGFAADLTLGELQAFLADPQAQAAPLLGQATSRVVYDVDRYQRTGQPPLTATLTRERHAQELGGAPAAIQLAFAYSDGLGRELQHKVQAEAGEAPQRQAEVISSGDVSPGALVRDGQGHPVPAELPRRWVGTGRTVFNNKGKPVKQYEPFFSSTHLYEPERELTDTGVSPVRFYDPVGRVIATLRPDQTYEKVVFDAWGQASYDANDTVTGAPRTDPDLAGYVDAYFAAQPTVVPTWYAMRIGNPLGDPERDAAQKAAAHSGTPSRAYLDALGRAFLTIAHNRYQHNAVLVEEVHATRLDLDLEGNPREVFDPRGRTLVRNVHDVAGRILQQATMDGGDRWMLSDVTGQPLRRWDSRELERRFTYDALRRPTGLFLTEGGVTRQTERTVYGEAQGAARNHRGRVYQVFDGAGVVITAAYDFKGNPLERRRELLPGYRQAVDWLANPATSGGAYTTRSTYDALERPVTVTSPDGSVYRPGYNAANLLERVDVHQRGASAATALVTEVAYDAKGRRARIAYGNGAVTRYEHDPLTQRLRRLTTTRPAQPDAVASQLFEQATLVQELRYTHDPVGNLTRIEDAAHKTIFHAGQQVDPVGRYTYDAVYRLIEAQGAEHLAQAALDFIPADGQHRDRPFVGVAHPNDLQALGNYTERYEYDLAGNLEVLRHLGGGSWTRSFEYQEASPLHVGESGNRLSRATVGNGGVHVEPFSYDAHGNTISMSHLAALRWDFKDQLERVELGGGGTAYYAYDAGGQRVRKVVEAAGGARRKERLDIGGFEVYREYEGDGEAVVLERQSLHVMDDQQRIALIDTLTIAGGVPRVSPTSLLRYQLGDHLGSSTVELDEDGALISYERYHPYGTTAFQAGRSAAEVSLKRYRYLGKERDEETGLGYHAARHYAPWLARWTSTDPLGIKDGPNVYAYARGNPVRFVDPQGTECNERDSSTCPQGAPPPPPATTGTLLPSADANGGGPPRDTPPPAPRARERSLYQLVLRDFPEAIGDSSRGFGERGGWLAPQYRAASYPVTGADQIVPSLGRAFRVVWDEHPQLRADVLNLGAGIWREHHGGLLAGAAFGLTGIALAAGLRNQWTPASTALSVGTSLVPAQTVNLGWRPTEPGDLFFRQLVFSLPSSTPIGRNEGANPVGLFPLLQFRGQYLERDVTLSLGLNARYLPERQQVRLQESLGVDQNFARFNIGRYRASLTGEGRLNLYQQIDLMPDPRAGSLPAEGTLMLQFRITEPPAPPSPRR